MCATNCQCEQLVQGVPGVSPVCLGSLWVFEGLNSTQLHALMQHAVRRRITRKQTVFHQGDPADALMLIKAGTVKLTKLLADGREITLDLRKAGDVLGETMLSEEAVYPFSAVAVEDSLLCGFDRQRFEALVLEHPTVGLQMIRTLSGRIGWLADHMENLAGGNLAERLYRTLANIARDHGQATPDGRAIPFSLTHEDLGFLVGAHRVSVTRALKELKRDGRVQETDRRLTVAPLPV